MDISTNEMKISHESVVNFRSLSRNKMDATRGLSRFSNSSAKLASLSLDTRRSRSMASQSLASGTTLFKDYF